MKKISILSSIIFCTFLFTSCGGGGGGVATSALQGSAVKSEIIGAQVQVWYFDSTGSEVQLDGTNAPVITGTDGSYQLELDITDLVGIESPLIIRTVGGTMGPAVGSTLYPAPTLEAVLADPTPLTNEKLTISADLTLASSVAAGLVRKQAALTGAAPTAADALAWSALVEDQLDLDLSGDPEDLNSGVCQVNICVDANLDLEDHPENNLAVQEYIDYLVANLTSSSGQLDGVMNSPGNPGVDATADFSVFSPGGLAAVLGSDPAGYVRLRIAADAAFINNDGSDTATVTAMIMDAAGRPVSDAGGIQFTLLSGRGTLEGLIRDNGTGSASIDFASGYHGDAIVQADYFLANGALLTQQVTISVVDLINDSDGDGFSDGEEELGWTVIIDENGYGANAGDPFMIFRQVSSDPDKADSDGDGLDDFTEYLIRTDPTSPDTDGDGLTDEAEWVRWDTNPCSVDSDGDSRGPDFNLTPNPALFDGNELNLSKTSPSLDDTDGDGKTDLEELFTLFRSPLVADLPRLEVDIVDKVDIRLDVEYAEEAGQERQYGSELLESTTVTESTYNENSMEFVVTVGGETEFGYEGGSGKIVQHINYEFSGGYGHVWSSTHETAEQTQSTYSEYVTDARTRTETAASGSMSTGIRFTNTGDITYTLTQLGLTVRMWQPGADRQNPDAPGSFKTLATLTPALEGGITLAPGEETPVLQLQAEGLNATRVKEFMVRPDSLYLEAASYELENAEGLNFAFLEEITAPRTGRLSIDFGDGRVEDYLVAAAVDRNPDGSFAGKTLGAVMNDILGIPFTTVPRTTLDPGALTNERVLYSVRNRTAYGGITGPRGYWTMALSSSPPAGIDFDDLVLFGNEKIMLVYINDQDGDNLLAPEEQHYGTDDETQTDTDGDGLTDAAEVRGELFIDADLNEIPCGWVVSVMGWNSYPVWSDPAHADQDEDGLNDLEEYTEGTDPTIPDTDRDGTPDGLDPWPLNPAMVLYVDASALAGGDGMSWDTAMNSLQSAVLMAATGYASTGTAVDDVAEIWVAAGSYQPSSTDTSASFVLVEAVGVFGGFSGVETKRSQRNPDPFSNGTFLTGDLTDNDTQDWGNRTDNSRHVVVTAGVSPATILDGFSITGGTATGSRGGAIYVSNARPTLDNLFLYSNRAGDGGGIGIDGASEITLDGVVFYNNRADTFGGGVFATADADLRIIDCQFQHNRAAPTSTDKGVGGGLYYGLSGTGGTAEVTGTMFLENEAWDGGGLGVRHGTMKVSNCEFKRNKAGDEGGGLFALEYTVGRTAPTRVLVRQSVFFGNEAYDYGGAVYANGLTTLNVLNSTFTGNFMTDEANWGRTGGLHISFTDWLSMDNNIVYGNRSLGAYEIAISQSSGALRNTCIDMAGLFIQVSSVSNLGYFNASPAFVDQPNGDLHLTNSSPCIDTGNNYVDYDPLTSGYQPLPGADLDGRWRLIDGNQDGEAIVDIGAYEYGDY